MIKNKWDLESAWKEALKYSYRNEFKKNSKSAYSYALRKKIIDQICGHMMVKNVQWTDEMLKEEALKYKNRIDFANKNKNAYNCACERKILDKICSHMNVNFIFWTIESIKNEALKYKTRKSFEFGSRCAYRAAMYRGIMDDVCTHMISKHTKYSNDLLVQMASHFSGKREFKQSNPNAYRVACRRGILDKIFSHIFVFAGTSSSEKSLLKTIKETYHTAKILRQTVFIPNKPHVHRFDIDIYIPELKKGIEYDGTYWHSLAGLRRSRPTWPQEDLENYHQIKDSYFKSKGIEILHIKEEDWLKDKEECMRRCFDFLKTT